MTIAIAGQQPTVLPAVRSVLDEMKTHDTDHLKPEDRFCGELWTRGFKVVPLQSRDLFPIAIGPEHSLALFLQEDDSAFEKWEDAIDQAKRIVEALEDAGWWFKR